MAEAPRGWELLAECVMTDVQGSSAVAEELIAATRAVLDGKNAQDETGGNAFYVYIGRERTRIQCQFDERHLEISTAEFLAALWDWRDFLLQRTSLARQRPT